jgi:hypothetical protein
MSGIKFQGQYFYIRKGERERLSGVEREAVKNFTVL